MTGANVNLLVAALDLKMVQLLRGAIRTADIASAAHRVSCASPAATIETRRVIHPEPRYEPRRIVHPEPRYEIRPVVRVENVRIDRIPFCDEPPASEPARIAKSPIEPPWKVLPWMNRILPVTPARVAVHPARRAVKGTMLDCFL